MKLVKISNQLQVGFGRGPEEVLIHVVVVCRVARAVTYKVHDMRQAVVSLPAIKTFVNWSLTRIGSLRSL
jgi:hypothetical protein